jgi:hypothetical protein
MRNKLNAPGRFKRQLDSKTAQEHPLRREEKPNGEARNHENDIARTDATLEESPPTRDYRRGERRAAGCERPESLSERATLIMRGDGRIFQRAGFYWVAYYLRGKEYREAAKTKDGKSTPDQKVAEKFLRDRLKDVHADEVGGRVFTTPKAFRLTVHDLVEALKADDELRGKLSAQNSSHLKRVQKDFGEYRSMDLTSERIDRYIEQRLDAGAAKASINRVTQMLGQAYKLAIRRGRLARPPYIRQLNESGNVRQGFFNEKEFVAVLAKLRAICKISHPGVSLPE